MPTGKSWAISWFSAACAVIGVATTVVYLWGIGGLALAQFSIMGLLIAVLIPPVFLLFPATKGAKEGPRWYDIVLSIVTLVGGVYVLVLGVRIQAEGWAVVPPLFAQVLGILLCVAILEGCRRTTGLGFTMVVLIFMLYPWFGRYLPGLLQSMPLSFPRFIGFTYLSTGSIFGLATQVMLELLLAFLVLAAVLQWGGAGDHLVRLGVSLAGRFTGGGAKASIVASGMVGMISGSAIANVLITGPFTIPTMKRSGYPPHYAGAVEAVSASGACLAPPIMGATAFVMANFIGQPYVAVMVAAAIPAFFYFFCIMMQVHFHAAKTRLRGLPASEIPSVWKTLREGWFILAALGFLIFELVYMRTEAKGAFYTAALLIVYKLVQAARKGGWIGVRESFKGLVKATADVLSSLTSLLVGAGMIVGAVSLTGLPQGVTSLLTSLAGGNPFVILGVGALACFVLGMGMTALPVYMFTALLVAPALINLGYDVMAVHLFILYWAMTSAITPPVAVASIVASRVAKSELMPTSLQALRLGIVMLVFPFAFVINPSLIGHGSVADIGVALVTSTLAIILIAAGIEGYFFRLGRLYPASRVALCIAGVIVIFQIWPTWYVGVLSVAILLLFTLAVEKMRWWLSRRVA